MNGPVTFPTLGDLDWVPATSRPDLLAPAVAAALARWGTQEPRVAEQVAVVEIDPDLADTATLNTARSEERRVGKECPV